MFEAPRIRAWLAFLAAGVVLALSLSQLVVSVGRPFPTSPLSLILTLALLGPLVFFLTLPIRRYQRRLLKFSEGRGTRPSRVNPFFAFRALILCRASSLGGSLFVGWHLGLLLALAILSVPVSTLLPSVLAGLIAAFTLYVFALFGELNCRIPGDHDQADGSTA